MVKISNLSYSYGNIPCLQNISLELGSGRIYGLLGENGVGKTTLLTLLAGLKKPQTGSIDAGGFKPFDREPDFLAGQFYLPDEVMPLRCAASDFARERGVFWPGFSMDVFNEIMSLFEMDSSWKMHRMSAGQLKKSWIAFALASGADRLYLDEPTNGLDIPAKAQFRKAVMTYTREDATIVISTHQVKDVENLIDPVIILDRKGVLLNAGIDEISSRLYFDYGTALNPDSLYAEQIPGGFIQVYRNVNGEESKVNMEALFNTVHQNKELVKEIFSHE